MGERKEKSRNKKGEHSKKKKEKKIKSFLELLVKEKDVTKLVRMKQRLNMNFWPMYYVLCKEF